VVYLLCLSEICSLSARLPIRAFLPLAGIFPATPALAFGIGQLLLFVGEIIDLLKSDRSILDRKSPRILASNQGGFRVGVGESSVAQSESAGSNGIALRNMAVGLVRNRDSCLLRLDVVW